MKKVFLLKFLIPKFQIHMHSHRQSKRHWKKTKKTSRNSSKKVSVKTQSVALVARIPVKTQPIRGIASIPKIIAKTKPGAKPGVTLRQIRLCSKKNPQKKTITQARQKDSTFCNYFIGEKFCEVQCPCTKKPHLGGGNSDIFGIFTLILGEMWFNLTSIFF